MNALQKTGTATATKIQTRISLKNGAPRNTKALSYDKAFVSHPNQTIQNNLRPLLAAMRMRSALSLMKPAASAWL